MAYYSLPSDKLKRKSKRTSKLKNLAQSYEVEFCIFQLGQIDNAFDSDFQRDLIWEIRSNEEVQKHLLASRKLGKHMEEEIDM